MCKKSTYLYIDLLERAQERKILPNQTQTNIAPITMAVPIVNELSAHYLDVLCSPSFIADCHYQYWLGKLSRLL
jgi:hypothetical protein